MDAYIFQAALLCDDCGRKKCMELDLARWAHGRGSVEDSDDYPQGPHSDGGGESDSPAHCDACNVFLENPLTAAGDEYVRQACFDFGATGAGAADVINEWAAFYECLIPSPDACEWNRFDICLAWFVFACEYYKDYADQCVILGRLKLIRYTPGRLSDSSRAMLENSSEHENALNILARLVRSQAGVKSGVRS